MIDNKSIEEKVVFGVAPAGKDGDVPVLLLGVPTGAWEYMKDGRTHLFDLTKIGLPVKIVMYGAKDHGTALGYIEGHMRQGNHAILDERHKDFSIIAEENSVQTTQKKLKIALEGLKEAASAYLRRTDRETIEVWALRRAVEDAQVALSAAFERSSVNG